MADVEFTQDVTHRDTPAPARGGSMGLITSIFGGVVSLALLVGVGIWGYKLMVRDVTGIPVVRALDGPMRIQPEDPGGRPADHQGLAVNAVAAQGSAAAPADRLILAPQPVVLSDEDVPQPALVRPVPREVPSDTPAAPAEDIDALVAEITRDVKENTFEVETESAPAALAAIVAPEPLMLDDAPAPSSEPVAAEPAIAPDVPGLARSLRPQRRPTAEVRLASATPAAVEDDGESLDVDPSNVPAGTRVVQLGAFESPDLARSSWENLSVRFGDYLIGKRRIVQQASSGGRTFYRLRAMGFDDLSDARRFCSALVAEGADCIPVVTR